MNAYEIGFRTPVPLPGRKDYLQVCDQWVSPGGAPCRVVDGFLEFELPERYSKGGVLVTDATVRVPLGNVAYVVTGPERPALPQEGPQEASKLPLPLPEPQDVPKPLKAVQAPPKKKAAKKGTGGAKA